MAHTLLVDDQYFSCNATPNRSLTSAGRSLWLALMAITILFLAIAATLIGAWPVLPFAGLEIGLVWFAFSRIAAHDADFEMLKVENAMFDLETRNGKKLFALTGNAQWAVLECKTRATRCTLTLRYRGQEVSLGRLLTDVERKDMAMRLRRLIRVLYVEELS
jgi:uncharacterized membrane protein